MSEITEGNKEAKRLFLQIKLEGEEIAKDMAKRGIFKMKKCTKKEIEEVQKAMFKASVVVLETVKKWKEQGKPFLISIGIGIIFIGLSNSGCQGPVAKRETFNVKAALYENETLLCEREIRCKEGIRNEYALSRNKKEYAAYFVLNRKGEDVIAENLTRNGKLKEEKKLNKEEILFGDRKFKFKLKIK